MVGAEEGIYTLNLHELHEDTLEKVRPGWLWRGEGLGGLGGLTPRPSVRLSALRPLADLAPLHLALLREQRAAVTLRYGEGRGGQGAGPAPCPPTLSEPLCPSPAGKSTHIWAHDLPGLFEQRRLQQQVPLSIPTNRLTQRIIPRSGTPGGYSGVGSGGRQRGRARSQGRIGPCTGLVTSGVSLGLSEPSFLVHQRRCPLPLPSGLLESKGTTVWQLWLLGWGALAVCLVVGRAWRQQTKCIFDSQPLAPLSDPEGEPGGVQGPLRGQPHEGLQSESAQRVSRQMN